MVVEDLQFYSIVCSKTYSVFLYECKYLPNIQLIFFVVVFCFVSNGADVSLESA